MGGVAEAGTGAVPPPRTGFADVHGPLLVPGFLGTLIAVERAVAINELLGYLLAPALAGPGGVALLPGLPLLVAAVARATVGAL